MLTVAGPASGRHRPVCAMSWSAAATPLADMNPDEVERIDRLMADVGIYDRNGGPISFSTFQILYADLSYRVLAHDVVGDVEVITAWFGFDHGDGIEPGRPLIFGTITLAAGVWADQVERLAPTEDEARANHAVALVWVPGRSSTHRCRVSDAVPGVPQSARPEQVRAWFHARMSWGLQLHWQEPRRAAVLPAATSGSQVCDVPPLHRTRPDLRRRRSGLVAFPDVRRGARVRRFGSRTPVNPQRLVSA